MQENLPQKGSRRARNGVAGMERERETGGVHKKKINRLAFRLIIVGKTRGEKSLKKLRR